MQVPRSRASRVCIPKPELGNEWKNSVVSAHRLCPYTANHYRRLPPAAKRCRRIRGFGPSNSFTEEKLHIPDRFCWRVGSHHKMISGGRIFASILGQDRTAGLFFRKESLYPTELPGRFFTQESLAWSPRFVYCAPHCFVFEPFPSR